MKHSLKEKDTTIASIYKYIKIDFLSTNIEYVCIKSSIATMNIYPAEWGPGYDTKLHRMVRLQFWRLEECEYPFTAITPRFTLSGSIC